MVLLNGLARDVERQIAVYQSAHERETVGQQVGALLADHHARSVEFEPFLVGLAVVVVGRLGRHIQ